MNTNSIKKKSLIKQFHTVCHNNGITPEDKEAILHQHGVESSLDLTEQHLIAIISKLNHEPDQWRKRVIAAISAWLQVVNKQSDIDNIKGIACRASGYERFNSIPISRLRDIYYEFSRKAKTSLEVKKFKAEELTILENQN